MWLRDFVFAVTSSCTITWTLEGGFWHEDIDGEEGGYCRGRYGMGKRDAVHGGTQDSDGNIGPDTVDIGLAIWF